MLWPIVLPFKITFWLLTGITALATAFAPLLNCKRGKTLLFSMLFACVVFVPSCVGIMSVIDAKRFGIFEYSTFSEVRDFRVERYLPTNARNITLDKYGMGHRAKYTITQSELTTYLDGLWNNFGEYSSVPRDEFDEGSTLNATEIPHEFEGFDWPQSPIVLQFHSPTQSDGGGATYYFDPTSNTAYHRAGYW